MSSNKKKDQYLSNYKENDNESYKKNNDNINITTNTDDLLNSHDEFDITSTALKKLDYN